MTKPIPYLAVGLGLAAASTAALAATFGMLRLAPVKTTREVLNLFASDKPVGGENAVPTVFVFSNDSDRSRYSHVGAQQIKTSLNLEFRQVCAGGGWKQYRIPHVHVGDQQWPSAGDGKPIVQPDGALYKATLTVASGKLELNPDLDPVKRCNAVIAAHTVNGKLPADLLGKGFWVRSEDGLKARIAPGCVKPAKCVGFCEDQYAGRETKWLPVWINCQPTGYVTTHRLPPEPHRTKPEAQRLAGALRDVSLAAVNSPLTRVCPATVVFRGRIRSNASVSGTYRLVGSGGYASPAYPFSLASNGERSIASQRRVELPAGSGGLAAPGGGTWPRIVRGWLQLEVALTHPDARVLRSPQADYEVRCLKPPSPGGTLRN